MATLRCTRKILTRLGGPSHSDDSDVRESLLGDWHLNMLSIERRRCLSTALGLGLPETS